jgi:hypothetical protein
MAEQKIGSKTYAVTPLLATQAIKLQVRLLKAIGPAVDKLPAILKGAGKDASPEDKLQSDAAAVAALMSIFQVADPDEFATLVQDVARLATVKRPSGTWDEVDIDAEFTGHLDEALPVLIFVLREQFGSFFSAALVRGTQRLPSGA